MTRKSKNALAVMMPRTHDQYEVQDAVHTLKRAQQIKDNPKLHAAAKAHAKQEVAALQKIARKK